VIQAMRIALVTSFYPNRAEPVRAVFVRNLVLALRCYASVTVISPVPYAPPLRLPKWQALRSIPRDVRDEGYTVAHPRYLVVPKLDSCSGITYFAGILGTLRRLAATWRIDLLAAHCGFPDAVGVALAARCLNLPYTITTHGSDINVYAERAVIRPQMAWALRNAAAIITVSEALRQKVCDLVPAASNRVVQIPCAGIDARMFHVGDRESALDALRIPRGTRIAVFAGRLVAIKAVDGLLRAWAKLQAEKRTSTTDLLAIIGNGPERQALERQSAAAGTQDSVRFLGELPQAEVARWLRAATVFCLPSRNEGTPNVVMEALACGRPVVASSVGGIPAMIADGRTGFLVEPANDTALADALWRALERPWDSAALAASVAGQSWGALAERNAEVFGRILADRREGAQCTR
jgi:teichuronic acid biosynthesis glycosyltransferase TuaC